MHELPDGYYMVIVSVIDLYIVIDLYMVIVYVIDLYMVIVYVIDLYIVLAGTTSWGQLCVFEHDMIQ